MTTADKPTPLDVFTTLKYHLALDDKPPYHYALLEPPPGTKKTNVSFETHPVVVHDARGREGEFTLDTAGFQFLASPCTEETFDDDERIKVQYYPEVEVLLKRVTGAKRVLIFNHIVRRSTEKRNGSARNRGPVEGVHVDQTYDATVKRVREHFLDDADRLLQSRVRLINVWRPIANPVAHKPLGVSDWRFVDEARDLVPVQLFMRHREGSTFSVRYNPNHRWYYLSNQTPHEVTLIKCYDSEVDGRARSSPHSAFLDPTSPKNAPHRQSIEVRALVFDAH